METTAITEKFLKAFTQFHFIPRLISDISHGFDKVSATAEFLPEGCNVHINRSALALKIISPHIENDIFTGKRHTFIFEKIL